MRPGDYITGIQQVGVGVTNARERMLFYKTLFGLDVLIFDDTSDATLMTRYTGDSVHNRRAILTMNLAGGGGFEIWQFNDRQPTMPQQVPQYGDIGIFAPRIKCRGIEAAHKFFNSEASVSTSPVETDQNDKQNFWLLDAYGNSFNILEGSDWFKKTNTYTGGVCGAVIGVSDMEQSINFYGKVLGIDEILTDYTGNFNDHFTGQTQQCRKVILRKKPAEAGAFKNLLGSIEIELVQCLERTPVRLFKDRFWGDCGFIHLCLDVINMTALKEYALSLGHSFTVDSKDSFAMENAAGRFCYVEDPDGTLIELVETHKIPILKKIGWYLDLKKRGISKPLPNWMINMLSLSKV